MKPISKWIMPFLFAAALTVSASADESRQPFIAGDKTLLIIGQDLESVRGYTGANCCPVPAGITTYIGLYNILNEAAGFGGIGIDAEGRPIDLEVDWGGGPSNAFKAGNEYPFSPLVIGLSLTENDHPGAMRRLLKGKYDAEIGQLAKLFSTVDAPVYLRVGYEFDGTWNQGYGNRKRYKAAYRYVVDKLRALGANNVDYVWQSATSPIDDLIEGGHENLEDWYPGDDYVDWMATSWFVLPDQTPVTNHHKGIGTGRSLQDEMLAFARKKNKPVMMAEVAPQGFDVARLQHRNIADIWDGPVGKLRKQLTAEELWDLWYQPFFDYVEKNRDVVKAVAYINANWDVQGLWDTPYEGGYWGDSRIQTIPVIQEKWLEQITKPWWQHGGEQLNKRLGYPRN